MTSHYSVISYSRLSYEIKYIIATYIGNKINLLRQGNNYFRRLSLIAILVRSTEGLRMKKNTHGQSELFSIRSTNKKPNIKIVGPLLIGC
jgi:hypothetical protein